MILWLRLFLKIQAWYTGDFAGMSDLDEALNQPLLTMELNIMGNLRILETCRKQRVGHFVYASSAYACSESGSFYGISKLSSEKIVEEYKPLWVRLYDYFVMVLYMGKMPIIVMVFIDC